MSCANLAKQKDKKLIISTNQLVFCGNLFVQDGN